MELREINTRLKKKYNLHKSHSIIGITLFFNSFFNYKNSLKFMDFRYITGLPGEHPIHR